MNSTTTEKLKVFISYSRRDSSDFAEELVAGLELAGFTPLLDRHDIAAGEDWEKRLGGLIQEADTVVFVVSPEAIKSERCGWEVDKTVELSKRLLPVIFKPVPDADIPQKLRQLQFVRFDTGPGVTRVRALNQLAEALRQDIDWNREHTRIGEIAARWQANGRREDTLLRGIVLKDATAWAVNRKPAAPEITDLQRAFLKASSESEIARQRRSKRFKGIAVVSGIVVLLIMYYAEG
jgi:TIR domain